jgi:tetratricopeptide (TPR) repeat protein
MRLRPLVLSSTLLASTAFAAVPPATSLPSAPAMTEVPRALTRRVASVTKQLERVQERCEDTGERNPGQYDRRCPTWLAGIGASGEAAAFAIAGAVLGEGDEALDFGTAMDTQTELFRILGASKSDAAIVALLRRLHRNASGDEEDFAATRTLDALGALTGYDAKAYVPRWWASEDKAWDVDTATKWLTWYEAHHADGRQAWAKAGLEQARGWSDSKVLAERCTAIRRLLQPDGDKAAALASVAGALSDPTLAGDNVWELEALARTAGLSDEGILAAGTARRKVLIARGDEDAAEEQAALDRRAEAAALVTTCKSALVGLRTEEAQVACKKATELDDTNSEALVTLGWAQLELGQVDAAATTAITAVDLIPSYDMPNVELTHAYTLLAAVRTVQGQLDEAKQALQSVRDDASTPEVAARRALLRGRLPAAAWTKSIAPTYFCWKAKSTEAATEFLARRGVNSPEALRKVVAALAEDRRGSLMAESASVCPWKVELSGGGQF